MKKTAILAMAAVGILAGCGIVDSVDPVRDPKPPVNTQDTTTSTSETEPTTSADETDESSETTTKPEKTSPAVTRKPSATTKAAATRAPSATRAVTTAKTTVSKETTVRTTYTTGVPVKITTTVPTAAIPNDPTAIGSEQITCNMRADGVEVTVNGEVAQFITQDMTELIAYYNGNPVEPSMLISICDFDFDGHDDLYIPEKIGAYNSTGSYWHFDPETGKFDEWDDLNEIGFAATASKDDKTVFVHVKDNAEEYEDKYYKWEDGKLVMFKMTKQFRLKENPELSGNLYIDHYEFVDGKKKTVKREQYVYDESGDLLGISEIPITWLLR